MRIAALRCLAAAFRSLPLPAAASMLRIAPTAGGAVGCGSDDSENVGGGAAVGSRSGCSAGETGPRAEPGKDGRGLRAPPNHGSVAAEDALTSSAVRAALAAAAAAGVRGAAVALEGLSAWDDDGGGGGGVDLCFRS